MFPGILLAVSALQTNPEKVQLENNKLLLLLISSRKDFTHNDRTRKFVSKLKYSSFKIKPKSFSRS